MHRPVRMTLAAAIGVLVLGASSASAATITVDDDGVQCPSPDYTAIQPAIDHAATGDTIHVCAGTYTGNLVLAKDVTLEGAQAGVDGRGRSGDESTVTAASGTLLELRTGSAGATVDGFTFDGGAQSIASTSGPIDRLTLENSRLVGFTGSGIFLNDNGSDVTITRNVVDGASTTGNGDLIHLDTDTFNGLWVTSNDVIHGATNTGLFSDGNRNVGPSGDRSPELANNRFKGNETGANIGRKSLTSADISGNEFSDSGFDGLQGGPANSTITGNTFADNGRSGLALTGFGGATDPNRGAQNNTITNNTFTGNAEEGVFFSSSQHAGTIATNRLNENDIAGNALGATYGGTETIDVTCNWWGSTTGPLEPTRNPGGMGNAVNGAGLAFQPWLVSPFASGDPCVGGPLVLTKGHGSGEINDATSGPVKFDFDAENKKNGETKGHVHVDDKDVKDRFKADSADYVVFNGNEVDFGGPGTFNKQPGYRYAVKAVDNGKPGGGNDTFEIRIWGPGGSFASPDKTYSGTLTKGDVKIDPAH